MPQQQLNGADVRAGFQQVNGEGVSERMWRHRLRETAATTGLAAGAVDDPARCAIRRLGRVRESPGNAGCESDKEQQRNQPPPRHGGRELLWGRAVAR